MCCRILSSKKCFEVHVSLSSLTKLLNFVWLAWLPRNMGMSFPGQASFAALEILLRLYKATIKLMHVLACICIHSYAHTYTCTWTHSLKYSLFSSAGSLSSSALVSLWHLLGAFTSFGLSTTIGPEPDVVHVSGSWRSIIAFLNLDLSPWQIPQWGLSRSSLYAGYQPEALLQDSHLTQPYWKLVAWAQVIHPSWNQVTFVLKILEDCWQS